MPRPTNKNPLADYEQHIRQLESLIGALENGELSLNDALKQYEQGIALVRACQQALDAAEQKIQMLNANSDRLAPFAHQMAQIDDNE